MKKIHHLVVWITMLILIGVASASFMTSALAASGAVSLDAIADTEVFQQSSEEQELSVTINMKPAVSVSAISGQVLCPDDWIVTALDTNTPNVLFSYSNSNNNFTWTVGGSYEDIDFEEITIHYIIPAYAAAGEYEVGVSKFLMENTNFDAKVSNATVSATVLIEEVAAIEIPVERIELGLSSAALKVGESISVGAKVFPEDATNQNIAWISSNTSVADVEDGIIYAKAVGIATISATAGGVITSCEVIVSDESSVEPDDPVEVEAVILDKSDIILEVGAATTLSATVVPENASNLNVEWVSTDSSIATVQGGVITAVAVGETTITVKAGNTEAICTVTVIENNGDNAEVKRVILSSTFLSLEEGDSEKISVSISPNTVTNYQIEWSSSNPSVATVQDGLVTAISAGSTLITAKVSEREATCAVTVIAKEDGDIGGGSGGSSGSEKIEYGLRESEIEGYVTISFEDNGIRLQEDIDKGDVEEEYLNPLGIIVSARKVPFKNGDSIANVTIRLLDELGWTYKYTGRIDSNFYLAAIQDFTIRGKNYTSFGEFDAGKKSGWMITWNDWFINQSTAAFNVENGDVIRWQYTCQLGADIGDSFQEGGSDDQPGSGGAGNTGDNGDGSDDSDSETENEESKDNDEDAIKEEESGKIDLTGNLPFNDVFVDAWYAEPVRWALENHITNGVSDTAFAPNESCTRAQIVTFLWRAAGSPKVEADNPFTDVTEGAWYYDAVLWAVKKGVTTGVTETRFAPNDTCTRAQAVTFLWRAAGKPAVSGTLSFTDVVPESWYGPAVKWAADHGITVGIGDGLFGVTQICTRAEIVTFLYRNR